MQGFRGFLSGSRAFSHQIATCGVFSRGHLQRPWPSGDHFRKVVELTEILGITWNYLELLGSPVIPVMEGIFRVWDGSGA